MLSERPGAERKGSGKGDVAVRASLHHRLSSVVSRLGELSCQGGEVVAPPLERWAGPEGAQP
jgi:hypothetical protein